MRIFVRDFKKMNRKGESSAIGIIGVALIVGIIWWFAGTRTSSANQTQALQSALDQANSNISALDDEITQANQDISDVNNSIQSAIDDGTCQDDGTLQKIDDTFNTYQTVSANNGN